MILSDYHLHTSFSSDSNTPMESVIEQAITLGFTRICITDHMDYDFPDRLNLPFTFDPDSYFNKIENCRKQYQEQIKISAGIELGLKPNLGERYQKLLSSYPFDFVIGSSHLVNDLDPFHSEYWANQTEVQAIRSYFESILENITAFHNYDVYGHLDYVVRYAPNKNANYHVADYQDLLDEILKKIIAYGLGIEVNTSGYKKGLGHPNPHPDIIKRYLELGGTILTIGSDAHLPEHIAYDFEKTRQLLLSLGVKEYTVFENREAILCPL